MSVTVRAFKLKSGEEIIGRSISSEDPIILEKVRLYIITGADQVTGQLQVNVIPYSSIAPDGAAEIYKDNIAAEILQMPKEVEDGYLSSTSDIHLVSGTP